MNQRTITIVVQIVLGLVVGVPIALALPIGNGWELLGFTIVFSTLVCAAGWLAGRFLGSPPALTGQLLLATLVVSGLGAAILLIPGAWGFQGMLFPLIGALVGYHLAIGRG